MLSSQSSDPTLDCPQSLDILSDHEVQIEPSGTQTQTQRRTPDHNSENVDTFQQPNGVQRPKKTISHVIKPNKLNQQTLRAYVSAKGFFSSGIRGTAHKICPHFNEKSFLGKDKSPQPLSQRLPLPSPRRSPDRPPLRSTREIIHDTMPVPKKRFVTRAKMALSKLSTQNSQLINQESQVVSVRHVLESLWNIAKLPLSPSEKALSQSQVLSSQLNDSACRISSLCESLSQEVRKPRKRRSNEGSFDSFISSDLPFKKCAVEEEQQFKLSPMSWI
ncbi:hypothetical protein P9112_009202 [Eukaryota sp. TZLM1-RC]